MKEDYSQMSKRELISIEMMKALVPNNGNYLTFGDMASDACNMADALLTEFEKRKPVDPPKSPK